MSANLDKGVADTLRESIVDLSMRQWRAIGGASAGAAIGKQVDLEALCLTSIALEEYEPRLWTTMADWIVLGSSLVSMQRLRNLARDFPAGDQHLSRFARLAVHDANDARWRPLVKSQRAAEQRRGSATRRRTAGPFLLTGPALALRVRAAFGVGVKADLIAFMLGQPFRVTVSAASVSLCYTVPPVFRALQDLQSAGLVHATAAAAATEYAMQSSDWAGVLGRANIAPWGYWSEVFGYACAVISWETARRQRSISEYARGALLRELATAHRAGIARSGILEHGESLPSSPDLGEWRAFHARLASRVEHAG